MQGDGVLRFVDSSRNALCEALRQNGSKQEPGWAWVMEHILRCCRSYPAGVTEAILLSELFQAWCDKERAEGLLSKHSSGKDILATKKRRACMPNAVTIDSLLEKNFIPLEAVMEVVILDIQVLPGTRIIVLTLGDIWSSNTIEHYLHCKYYDMAQGTGAVLRKGRDIRLTGCRLRASISGPPRLLPTEYLVTMLEEDKDDDALFLGAQFCGDTIESLEASSVDASADYYLYGRLGEIADHEVQMKTGAVRQKELSVVDNGGDSVSFVLWDEQVYLASLLSVGSMVALEKPFVAKNPNGTSSLCLQFGSSTRLFSIQHSPHLEQDSSELTHHTLKSTSNNSVVALPYDLSGSIDCGRCGVRLSICDLRPRMCNLALYVTIESVACHVKNQKRCIVLVVKDETGKIAAEMDFADLMRLNAGELLVGQCIFIAGLSTCINKDASLKCCADSEKLFLINVSRLPAIITSTCLHYAVTLHEWSSCGQVCRVRLGKISLENVQLGYVHSSCGQAVSASRSCDLCCISADDVIQQFWCVVPVLDDVVDNPSTEVSALLAGEAAVTMLSVSAESFFTWPEDERALYLLSLEGEEFFVTFCSGIAEYGTSCLRIACATKCT